MEPVNHHHCNAAARSVTVIHLIQVTAFFSRRSSMHAQFVFDNTNIHPL